MIINQIHSTNRTLRLIEKLKRAKIINGCWLLAIGFWAKGRGIFDDCLIKQHRLHQIDAAYVVFCGL